MRKKKRKKNKLKGTDRKFPTQLWVIFKVLCDP